MNGATSYYRAKAAGDVVHTACSQSSSTFTSYLACKAGVTINLGITNRTTVVKGKHARTARTPNASDLIRHG